MDVSGLFGGVALSGFELTSAADNVRIGRLRFAPEPEAASRAALDSFAALALRGRRRSARAARASRGSDTGAIRG